VRKSKSAQFKIRSCHGKRSSVLGEQTEIEWLLRIVIDANLCIYIYIYIYIYSYDVA
jgi:hypothetical protein